MSTNLLSCFKHAIIIIARNLTYLLLNEVIIMRRFYSHLPYYLVIFFFYWPLYQLLSLIISDPLLLKSLYVNNILFFTPLVILIISLLYSYRFRFSLWWLIGNGLLFCFTIITFGEFILTLLSNLWNLGSGGHGFRYWHQAYSTKMKNKKLSQNPWKISQSCYNNP